MASEHRECGWWTEALNVSCHSVFTVVVAIALALSGEGKGEVKMSTRSTDTRKRIQMGDGAGVGRRIPQSPASPCLLEGWGSRRGGG